MRCFRKKKRKPVCICIGSWTSQNIRNPDDEIHRKYEFRSILPEEAEEAEAYLSDPYLSGNLLEISKALLELKESNPSRIFGYPDDLKLRSCMTLFYLAAEGEEKAVFKAVLDKYYSGQQDDLTIKRLGRNR